MRKYKFVVSTMMAIMLMGTGFMVSAEEKQPAGYHIYDVQEDQASDTWYGIARGDYLRAGVSKITKGSSSKYAVCIGTTFAHRDCDRVYTRVYLDQSDNGSSGWWTVNYWTATTYDNSMATAESGDYSITRDKYYRAQGTHSVTESNVVESTTTCTDALYFD